MVRMWNLELSQRFDPAEATLALAKGDAETRSVLVLVGWVLATSVAGWILTQRRPVQ